MYLDNVNTVGHGKNAPFDRSSSHSARDSSYYLLGDSDILENIVDLMTESKLCKMYVLRTNDLLQRQQG